MKKHTEQEIRDALSGVKDPELQIDIVTLGLVRKVTVDDPEALGVTGAEILMTLTTPLCPFTDQLIGDIEDTLHKLGVEHPRVELTFDPPWEPPEELKASLGV